jgi:hypothetical protein
VRVYRDAEICGVGLVMLGDEDWRRSAMLDASGVMGGSAIRRSPLLGRI